MEIKNWKDELAKTLKEIETVNIRLGMEIQSLKDRFYYKHLLGFLSGKTKDGGMYLEYLKPLYDKYGYEKVNRVLLETYEGEKEDE